MRRCAPVKPKTMAASTKKMIVSSSINMRCLSSNHTTRQARRDGVGFPRRHAGLTQTSKRQSRRAQVREGEDSSPTSRNSTTPVSPMPTKAYRADRLDGNEFILINDNTIIFFVDLAIIFSLGRRALLMMVCHRRRVKRSAHSAEASPLSRSGRVTRRSVTGSHLPLRLLHRSGITAPFVQALCRPSSARRGERGLGAAMGAPAFDLAGGQGNAPSTRGMKIRRKASVYCCNGQQAPGMDPVHWSVR